MRGQSRAEFWYERSQYHDKSIGGVNEGGRNGNGRKNIKRASKFGQRSNVICKYWKMIVQPKANPLSPVPSFLFSKNGLWCFASTCLRDAVRIDYTHFPKVI